MYEFNKDFYYLVFYKNETIYYIESGPYANREECIAQRDIANANNNGGGCYRVAKEERVISIDLDD